ncbi:MAG: hypothetical protein R2932_17515 [Caldilineaceae bacterium]
MVLGKLYETDEPYRWAEAAAVYGEAAPLFDAVGLAIEAAEARYQVGYATWRNYGPNDALIHLQLAADQYRALQETQPSAW